MKFIENDRGFTYTLEAMIGIFLIIGMVLFFTNNMPYMAQKTGEHSKVQLMNIGRDALDLLEVTPVTDIFEFYWEGQVYRNYTLVADKSFVEPGENITFTVYKLGNVGPENILYGNLTLSSTILGLDGEKDIWTINGIFTTNFSNTGEFNVRAYEGVYKDPISWSNYVTINVGYYYLDTDIRGIYDGGDKNISGVVYNSTGSGVPYLTTEMLYHDYDVVVSPVDYTEPGRIIDDCENSSLWTASDTINLNSTNISESNSISVHSDSNFWLKKTISTTYNFDKNDILSFYFFSINGNETIDVELSNSSGSVTGKLTWNNINSLNSGWNKINTILKYPNKVEGIIKIEDADTIEIKVSNVTTNKDYLFDNFIAGEGRFSFIWPELDEDNKAIKSGSYYLQARDSNDNTSNKHRIIYSDGGLLVSDKYVIYEGDSTTLTMYNHSIVHFNMFNINQHLYNTYDKNKINLSDLIIYDDKIELTLTSYTAGDYYIFNGNTAQGKDKDPAVAAKTNTILIKVLPIDRPCNIGECLVCGGINLTALNEYMRRYLPPYVNFNLYLINPDGTLCYDCPEFKEIINGYPTSEAVTVNKIIHLNQQRDLGFMREIRMVLWYK